MIFLFSTGHQYSTFDWVHQRPQNQPQSWHHQCGDSLQGMHTAQIAIAVKVACSMFLQTVLTGLTLLSAHGAHHGWHRGPLWPVEPLLLEGQVRTVSRFLFAHSACLFTVMSDLQNVHMTHFIINHSLLNWFMSLKRKNVQWNWRQVAVLVHLLSGSLFVVLFDNAIVHSGAVWECWQPIRLRRCVFRFCHQQFI